MQRPRRARRNRPRSRDPRRFADDRRGRARALGQGSLHQDELVGPAHADPEAAGRALRRAVEEAREEEARAGAPRHGREELRSGVEGQEGRQGQLRHDLGRRPAPPDASLHGHRLGARQTLFRPIPLGAALLGLQGHAPARREFFGLRRQALDRRALVTDGRRRPRLLRRARTRRRGGRDRRRAAQGDPRTSVLPDVRRPRLPLARSPRADALGRRIAAHSPRQPGGLGANRRRLHPRRAVDRPAPARQPPAPRHADPHARHRQHRRRRRTRRGDGARGGHGDRFRPRRRRGRRTRRPRGHAEEPDAFARSRLPAPISRGAPRSRCPRHAAPRAAG